MRVLAAGSLMALLTTPGAAQSALDTQLRTVFSPAESVENEPDTLNCTALYRALSLALGPDTETGAAFRAQEGFMATVAAALWIASPDQVERNEDAVFARLVPMIDAGTTLYLAHMDGLAATSDAPFDDAIFGRLAFCNAIYDALQAE